MNMRGLLAAAIAGLVLVACGSSPSTTPQGPTVASVAVQSSDLPSGMHRCDLSGDVNSFLNKVKTSSPSTYKSTQAEWAAAQKNGAIAAEFVFFTDSTANCKAVGSNTSQISTATFKLVVNVVVQFKDEATAAKGYSTESILGFSKAQLTAPGSLAAVGTKTGLGPNSVTLSVSISNQAFYIAVWQQKAFMVVLVILNVDSATSQKVALKENGRIQ
jgi:hypothetical protein